VGFAESGHGGKRIGRGGDDAGNRGSPLATKEHRADRCHDRRNARQRPAEQGQLGDQSISVEAQQLGFLELLATAPAAVEQGSSEIVADLV